MNASLRVWTTSVDLYALAYRGILGGSHNQHPVFVAMFVVEGHFWSSDLEVKNHHVGSHKQRIPSDMAIFSAHLDSSLKWTNKMP
jgi:hypothetical protein